MLNILKICFCLCLWVYLSLALSGLWLLLFLNPFDTSFLKYTLSKRLSRTILKQNRNAIF